MSRRRNPLPTMSDSQVLKVAAQLLDGQAKDIRASSERYHRGFTRDGRAALEWQLLTKCRRCIGMLRHEPCRICGGRWYLDDFDDHEVIYTTLEGMLLEEPR